MTVPTSLRQPELDEVWARARSRLELRGIDGRGRLRLPALSSSAKQALSALIGEPVGKTLDLAVLEAGLARLGVGEDLPQALAALGHEMSDEPERRAERAVRAEARVAARTIASEWPEPWAEAWIDDVIRAGILRGYDSDQARALLERVRAVLDYLGQERSAPISRVELASQVLGSAHALDTGTRLEAAVARALAFKIGPVDQRDLWAQAGVHFDLTSVPVLTWRLPLAADTGLASLAAAAWDAGIPLHLSRFALEAYPAQVPNGSRILVVENPRLVEIAAERRVATPLLSTNGRPSSTVLLLLRQLFDSGAQLRCHTNFDTAGLATCAHLARLGLVPWRMTADDYLAALAEAEAEGAALPREPHPPGPTPWDPRLAEVFERERRVVHQERLLETLIGGGEST